MPSAIPLAMPSTPGLGPNLRVASLIIFLVSLGCGGLVENANGFPGADGGTVPGPGSDSGAAQGPDAGVISGGDSGTPFTDAGVVAPANMLPPVPQHGLLFGTFVGTTSGQSTMDALDAFEAAMGRKMDLHRIYSRFNDPQPNPLAVEDLARGRTPVLSITAAVHPSGADTWASIAQGDHDDDIIRQAKALAGLKRPIFLSFNHEPDVSVTNFGTTADYVKAWRHYVSVFRGQRVSNVAFLWILTSSSFSNGNANDYYPGDDVIDWVGVDVYNWFGCNPHVTTSWRQLGDALGPLFVWDRPHAKPIILAEWGSVEDPLDSGRKASWLNAAQTTFANEGNVKAISYFDTHGTCDWWLSSSVSTTQAYQSLAVDGSSRGVPSAWLKLSGSSGRAPYSVSLDGSGSTGYLSDPGHGISAWKVDFGDGSAVAMGTGEPSETLEHSFAKKGSYSISLTVTDWTGKTAYDTSVVEAN